MSGERRPVFRIPSIFDSDDDSEEETPTIPYRGITTTTTTAKPVTETQAESAPPKPSEETQSLSSNSESDGEPLSPRPVEAKEGKDPASSLQAQSSSEDSDNSEDELGEKDLVFSSKGKLEEEEEDANVTNEEDDINISHSSPENQDGSEDDDDDSSNSDDDDDDSDDENDRSASSGDYEGAASENGSSRVVYSPATPLSIKITTDRKGEFSIRQDTSSSKSPIQVNKENEEEDNESEKEEEMQAEEKEKENQLEDMEEEENQLDEKEEEMQSEEKNQLEEMEEEIQAEEKEEEENQLEEKENQLEEKENQSEEIKEEENKLEEKEEEKNQLEEKEEEENKLEEKEKQLEEKEEKRNQLEEEESQLEEKGEEGNKVEEKERLTEVEEMKEDHQQKEEEEEEEEMEVAETETDKAEEVAADEEEEMEVMEKEEEKKIEENSNRSTPAHEETEEAKENEGKECKVLSEEEKEEEREKEDEEKEEEEEEEEEDEDEKKEEGEELEDNVEINKESAYSEAEESKDEEHIQHDTEDAESKAESESESIDEALDKSDSVPVQTTSKESISKPEVMENKDDGNESDAEALEVKESEALKSQEPEVKEQDEEELDIKEEPMEVEDNDMAVKDNETDKDKEEIEEKIKTEEEKNVNKPLDDAKSEEKEKEREDKRKDEGDKTKERKIEKEITGEKNEEKTAVKEEEELTIKTDMEMIQEEEGEKEEVEEEEEGEEEEEEEDEGSKGMDSAPSGSAPMSIIMDLDSDSDASLDGQKSSSAIPPAASKGKVPLRVEDVYMDSDDESHISSCSPRPESPCDLLSTLRQSARVKRTPAPTASELADYLEAFKQGWQREIVFRATQNPAKSGNARADIYYYSPLGKKLRSRVEIEDYLSQMEITDLTLKNFTWIKQSLGVSKEYEKIRHASNKTIPAASSRHKPGQETPTSSTNTSPSSTPRSSSSSQIQTPKAIPPLVALSSIAATPLIRQPPLAKPPIATPIMVPTTASPATTVTPVVSSVPTVNPNVAIGEVVLPKKRGRGRPRKNPEEAPAKKARTKGSAYVPIMIKKGAPQSNVASSIAPPASTPTSLPLHAVPPGMAHLQIRPATQVMNVTSQRPILPAPTLKVKPPARKKKDAIVTTGHVTYLPPCPPKILTPMLIGGARQRTFHCTGNCPLGGGSVPCLQCLKCLCLFHPECTCMPPPTVSIIQAGAAKFLCPNCYWENKENMGCKKLVPHEPFEPFAHDPTSSSSSDTDEEGGEDREVWLEDYVKVCVRPDTPPTPPSSPSPSHSLGAWRTDGSESRQVSSEHSQTGEGGDASRDLPSTSHLPHSNRVLEGQLVQIQQQGGAPACFLLVQGGPRMPAGNGVGMPKGMPSVIMPSLPVQQQQQQQVQMASPLMLQQPQGQPSQIQPCSVPATVPPQAPVTQKPERQVGKHYKQYYKVMSQWDNTFLGELSQRYLLLRHIFKFLSVRDLLVASQVCLLWRDLAFSSTLWETVRLRNVCVKDWTEFARFLDRRNTRNVDLRKMRLKKQNSRRTRALSIQSRKEQKHTKAKIQKGSTSFQPILKSSDKPGTSRDQRSDSEEKNGKKSRRESEEKSNEEEKSKARITSNSQDQDEESEEENGRLVIDEKDRNGEGKDKKVKQEEMETEDVKDTQTKEDQFMECTEEEEEDRRALRQTPAGKQETEEAEWLETFTALSNVTCLRSVTLPSCSGRVLQILLASCKHITSINAMDLRDSSGCVRFDPAFLMEAPDLVELRIGSATGFSLTTNFNFIKLQKLRVLVMRGLTGDTWPYLGTNLTTLQVGPVRTFSPSTWTNLGNMTNLKALWLEEGGSMFDTNIYEGLNRLTNLRRLCLFNFVIGPKMGHALKKLPKLERLFILPVATEEATIKSQNGNMVVALEMLRNVEELVWGVHASDVHHTAGMDCIQMCPSKAKILSGMMENPESSSWPLHQLENALRKHLPQSNIRIIKLDPTAASHLALAIL